MERNNRKVQKGVVLSNKMQKTVIVRVSQRMRHPKYGKLIERRKKYYAHNPSFSIQEGDEVKILETRPLSKLKRWVVTEVLEKSNRG